MSLYLTAIQPNPPGKDTSSPGFATNGKMNEEWVEFEVTADSRELSGDELHHLTFLSTACQVTGRERLARFSSASLRRGDRVRVHTGLGQPYWDGRVLHLFLGRRWFVWNNRCGDRAVLEYNGATIDWAEYGPNSPERVLHRIPGTNRFV